MRVTLVVLAVLSADATAAPRPVTVFMERGGESVMSDGERVTIPRFGGGDRVWAATVACVKQQFAAFQIEIVDQRPAGHDFITAVIGGRASLLGLDDEQTNGVGPYDGSVLRGATVHVFSQVGTGERDVANLCSVTAHEVGHALGLEHEYRCGDVMSYFHDECGPERFLDVDAPCGEDAARACGTGDATQNSYRRLAMLVGLKAEAPAASPAPAPGAAPAPAADPWDGQAEVADDEPAVLDDADEVDDPADDGDEPDHDVTDPADPDDSTDEPEQAPPRRSCGG